MKTNISVLALASLCAACGTNLQTTGADRDAYGCIGSAGYTWSQVAGDCLRLWEAGVQLTSATDPQASLAAYVVISADGNAVELFLPKQDALILKRSFTPDGPVWTKGGWRLERQPEGWRLYQHKELVYQAANPADGSR